MHMCNMSIMFNLFWRVLSFAIILSYHKLIVLSIIAAVYGFWLKFRYFRGMNLLSKAIVWLNVHLFYWIDEHKNKHDSLSTRRVCAFIGLPLVMGIFQLVFIQGLKGIWLAVSYFLYSKTPENVKNDIFTGFYSKISIFLTIAALLFTCLAPLTRRLTKENGGLGLSLRKNSVKENIVEPLTEGMPEKTRKIIRGFNPYFTLVALSLIWGLLLVIVHDALLGVFCAFGINALGSSAATRGGVSQIRPDSASIYLAVTSIVGTLVAAPVIEEIFYRGIIAKNLILSRFCSVKTTKPVSVKAYNKPPKRELWQTGLVLLISGLWFGVGHLQFGYDTPQKIAFLAVFMTVFAAMQAYISTIRTRSVLPAIGAHFVYNAIMLGVALL